MCYNGNSRNTDQSKGRQRQSFWCVLVSSQLISLHYFWYFGSFSYAKLIIMFNSFVIFPIFQRIDFLYHLMLFLRAATTWWWIFILIVFDLKLIFFSRYFYGPHVSIAILPITTKRGIYIIGTATFSPWFKSNPKNLKKGGSLRFRVLGRIFFRNFN